MMTAPRAYRWHPWFCGACPNVHLIFYDKDDVPICEATFTAQQADRIGAMIRDRDPNFKTPTGGEMDR